MRRSGDRWRESVCADPRNHKSMSFTERGDHAAGILRQHDTLGVLPIPENANFTFWE